MTVLLAAIAMARLYQGLVAAGVVLTGLPVGALLLLLVNEWLAEDGGPLHSSYGLILPIWFGIASVPIGLGLLAGGLLGLWLLGRGRAVWLALRAPLLIAGVIAAGLLVLLAVPTLP